MTSITAAVARYYNDLTGTDLTWSELATKEILNPLNMTHSFFGALPQELLPHIGITGGENWADLLLGTGFDPAAGLWVRTATYYVLYLSIDG
jgi:CubicO group peptidase (beta-lactamase class C family)